MAPIILSCTVAKFENGICQWTPGFPWIARVMTRITTSRSTAIGGGLGRSRPRVSAENYPLLSRTDRSAWSGVTP
ncbi:hypothetical protein PGQ11_007480 [Apiospora arundinis]|uniref:Uncharacterized protein n=1 Tax=Apiospora arundinis TaxID=335852 RepID=A0ABR2IW93_9PEZI